MIFPIKTWTGNQTWEDDGKPFNVTIPNWKASSNLQHEWIELPIDQFGPVSGGLAVRLPGSVHNSSQAIIGCSISAFWFSGEITSDSLANEAAWSFTKTVNQWASILTDLNATSPIANTYRRLITIRPEWFNSLTLLTSCVSHSNLTQHLSTLSCLFSDVGFSTVLSDMRTEGQPEWDGQSCVHQPPNLSETDVSRYNRADCLNGGTHQLVEMTLGSVLANGLSRHGSRYAFSTSSILASPGNPFKWIFNSPRLALNHNISILKNDPHHNAVLRAPTDTPYVNLRMHIRVAGYAWYASGFSEYFAIAVALTYMLVALSHTVWVLATGVTSSSWDTVTELLALALESPVPEALKGSGAGIEKLGTYRRMVRLRARKEETGSGDERVVLVVDGEEGAGRQVKYRTDTSEDGESRPRARYRRVEVEKAYL
ncbi:MAG: hypothetical protein OHK93_008001 [Ramalina farinacea]|uniref:Uncharacterized protein n=1 Tax=Ramalina farinacea TaxID=258253 RepID=A0AA43QLL8_9LECA|nr:hypothetical protein [Ramalina farinacea]